MLDEGKVLTVRGAMDPEEVGICTTHEHLLFDWVGAYWQEPEDDEGKALAGSTITLGNRGLLNRNPTAIKENLVQRDVEVAAAELSDFRRAGGRTVVEVTPIGQGRDPRGLQQVSEKSGVNIVMSTGFYIQSGHPAYVAEKSIDELAEILVKDLVEGVDGTGIRAGFIGDVGTTKEVTGDERKVLRACARAHLQTGAAIGVHIDPSAASALTVIQILFEEGVRPERIVMEHMDEHPDHDYHLRVAETGVSLEFDTWGTEVYFGAPYYMPDPRDTQRVEYAKFLIDRGYAGQLLMAQDVWLKQSLKTYGGEGYDSFLKYGMPMLERAGVTPGQIRTMLVDNPMKVLPLSL